MAYVIDKLQDRRSKGWFWDTNDIFDAGLSCYAISVRMYLARCADINGQCFPAISTIAEKCGTSRTSVVRALKELEEKGWIKRTSRKIPGSKAKATSIYTLLTPNIQKGQPDNKKDVIEETEANNTDLGPHRTEGRTTGNLGSDHIEPTLGPQGTREGLPNEGLNIEGRSIEEDRPDSEEPVPSDNKPEIKYPLESIPFLLAHYLRAKILERDPGTKVPAYNLVALQSWATEADRMIRLDNRDPTEAQELIEWCQKDDFWSSNILSMSSFRKQYDRLKRQRETDMCRGGTGYGRSNTASEKPKNNKYAHLYK